MTEHVICVLSDQWTTSCDYPVNQIILIEPILQDYMDNGFTDELRHVVLHMSGYEPNIENPYWSDDMDLWEEDLARQFKAITAVRDTPFGNLDAAWEYYSKANNVTDLTEEWAWGNWFTEVCFTKEKALSYLQTINCDGGICKELIETVDRQDVHPIISTVRRNLETLLVKEDGRLNHEVSRYFERSGFTVKVEDRDENGFPTKFSIQTRKGKIYNA